MGMKIRLSRFGCENKLFYRVMAANSRSPRDGKHLEVLGYYNPLSGIVVDYKRHGFSFKIAILKDKRELTDVKKKCFLVGNWQEDPLCSSRQSRLAESDVGGEVLQWDFDLHFLSNYTLCEMVLEVGYRGVKNFIYYEGGLDFNTPDVVDDRMLLPTTRERELNSGGEIPNCNEELNSGTKLSNYNKGVNSGVGEPFIELGGESNARLELGESNIACAKSGEQNSESSCSANIDNSLGSEEFLRQILKMKRIPELVVVLHELRTHHSSKKRLVISSHEHPDIWLFAASRLIGSLELPDIGSL
ncbi:hypothetical protein Gotur_033545 [Gossypium turneri]